MKRGDLVIIRESGTPASKGRPCVIVQRDSALSVAEKVTVCPLTLRLRGAVGQRPFVAPNADNRLQAPSEVEVDWIYTHETNRIGKVIGRLDVATMDIIDEALRRWLDL